MSGSALPAGSALLAGERRTYAIPGLPWGCSPAEARSHLKNGSCTTVSELTSTGVLPFESEEQGYSVRGEAHFTWGVLTHVRMTCVRQEADAPSPAEFFGDMSGLFVRVHGPYEPTSEIMAGTIAREWPSDDRGSLRMTLDVRAGEIVITYHSGVRS